MAMNTFQQDDFKVEMVGEVTGPPSFLDVVAKIGEAAEFKQEVVLTAAEARVLINQLSEE